MGLVVLVEAGLAYPNATTSAPCRETESQALGEVFCFREQRKQLGIVTGALRRLQEAKEKLRNTANGRDQL